MKATEDSKAAILSDLPPTDLSTGLQFSVASTEHEVLEAWELVYYAYLRTGLITPNPHRLHTVRQALLSDAVVVMVGRIGDLTVSTLSAYTEGSNGLPLDQTYTAQLDDLRSQGRRLAEFGLFADRREHLYRSLHSLLEMMRYATYFAVNSGATDAVIGVHPHHVPFYRRMLGFEVAGPETTYPCVNNAPVVLLRLDWYRAIKGHRLPRGLAYLRDNPIPAGAFKERWRPNISPPNSSRLRNLLSEADCAVA